MNMLGDDPDKTWEVLGSQNPYFGVLTSARFRSGRLDEDVKREFFESGEDHIVWLLKTVESMLGPVRRGRALDFGCGVGRLTLPLRSSAGFAKVTGLDISPSMLAEAGRNAHQRKLEGMSFDLSDDKLGRVDGTFDFVHSFIVLQHIPVARGEQIVRRLVSKLAPGGIAALQVPIARPTTRMRSLASALRTKSKPAHLLANVIQGRAWDEPLMQMNRYSLNALFALLHGDGIRRLAVELIEEGGNIGAYLLIKAEPNAKPD